MRPHEATGSAPVPKRQLAGSSAMTRRVGTLSARLGHQLARTYAGSARSHSGITTGQLITTGQSGGRRAREA
ncbi:hypothetical protein SBD_0219 [Streptomyces bottropensis ATCC 25435]|uniref:Uncharacterized protein n=1 Tax=Streptomyces bottropensis ATCC 25435 TaxID=1054862 RepID=M3F7D0_9ACTN|nr:hypothetical protein SBD_0219 [Streptomyces bottropensis ATCC 25435]